MKFGDEKPDLELVSDGEVVEKSEEFVAPELGEIKDNLEDDSVIEESYSQASESPNIVKDVNTVNSTDVDKLAYYSCRSCGAKFAVSLYAPIGVCAFCGLGQIVKENEIDLSNQYILPFVCSMNNAKKDYKKKVMFNPLIPIVFKKKRTIKKIKKLYIPCMIYDIDVRGPISFTAADSVRNAPNVPKQVYECGFSTNFNFENIVNCSYSQIGDEMFSTISQYNCSSMKEFDSSFLSDSMLIYPNEDKNQNLEKINNRINKYCTSLARDSVNHELKKVKENKLVFNIKTSREVFVPVYFLNVKYRGRHYTFIKNGQNAKSAMDTVTEKKYLIIYAIIVFIISFIILLLLSFLF